MLWTQSSRCLIHPVRALKFVFLPTGSTQHWFLSAASRDVMGEKKKKKSLNSPTSGWLVSLAPSSWCIAGLSPSAAFWCGMLEKKPPWRPSKSLWHHQESPWLLRAPPSSAAGSFGSHNCFWSCVFFSPAVQEFHFFLALRCNEVCLNRGGNTVLIF